MGEIKKMHEKIEDLKKYIVILEAALDHLNEAIYIGDEEGLIYFINKEAEKIDGNSKEAVIGRNEQDVYGTDYALMVTETNKYIENERTTYKPEDGLVKYVLHSVYPVEYKGEIKGNISISKDITREDRYITKIIELQHELKHQTKEFKKNGTRYVLEDIMGKSISILNAIRFAEKATRFESNIMICGETGTGKEMFAQGMHNAGINQNAPFVGLNCGAVPENLMESLLFGTVKGAFTGATDSKGLFEQAGHGTLFLDEIDSMPLQMQAKLLRVLQEKTIRKIGGKEEIPIKCKIISATNIDIDEALLEKKIRADIYYRLASVVVKIPPLNQRKGDVLLLTREFIRRFESLFGIEDIQISPDIEDVFQAYPWPGNVRELEHVIEGALLMMNDNEKEISLRHLPEKIYKNSIKYGKLQEKKGRTIVTDLQKATQDFERKIITDCLRENNGNASSTAKYLNINRSTLYRKMEQLKINRNDYVLRKVVSDDMLSQNGTVHNTKW